VKQECLSVWGPLHIHGCNSELTDHIHTPYAALMEKYATMLLWFAKWTFVGYHALFWEWLQFL